MIFQTQSVQVSTFVVGEKLSGHQSALGVRTENLSDMLIALCTADWNGFFANKAELSGYPIDQVCAEASRLSAKNARSFRLLSIVSHCSFFSNWEYETPKDQVVLYGALAFHSINKTAKETAFHCVAKAIRKDLLARQNVRTPTKIRLRDCHQLIARFMHEYADIGEVNRSIVLAALAEGEASGCGHLPSQQAIALMKRLQRGGCLS